MVAAPALVYICGGGGGGGGGGDKWGKYIMPTWLPRQGVCWLCSHVLVDKKDFQILISQVILIENQWRLVPYKIGKEAKMKIQCGNGIQISNNEHHV